MGKSIFEFADKFGFDSPWEQDWLAKDKLARQERTAQLVASRKKQGDIDVEDKGKLLESVLLFSRSLPLYTSMGEKFPHWKTKGVNDRKTQKILIEFGKTNQGFKGEMMFDDFGPIKIILNEDLIGNFTVPSFSQILFQEWGNAKNWKRHAEIANNPKKYTREDFIRNIEKLEFDIRMEIVYAYINNQFDNAKYEKQDCIFSIQIKDFESYYNAPELSKHKEQYGKVWDEENSN